MSAGIEFEREWAMPSGRTFSIKPIKRLVESLCAEVLDEYRIDPRYYEGDAVKRGLRNTDGTGVIAGVTRIGKIILIVF